MTDDALAALYAASFPNDAAHWNAQSFAQFRQNPSNHIFEHPKGALLAQIILDEAEIISLFVDPSARQSRIAQGLLSEFLAKCQELGVQSVHLEVAKDNTAAISLYQKNGFEPISTRPNYYKRRDGTQVDALVFRLNP